MKGGESMNYIYKLKDYKRTHDTYKGYKTTKWKAFTEKHVGRIIEHYESLPKLILDTIDGKRYGETFKLLHNRTDTRYLFHAINSVTYDLNKQFIKKCLKKTNENEIRYFAILLYLTYYCTINKIMTDTFNTMREERSTYVV